MNKKENKSESFKDRLNDFLHSRSFPYIVIFFIIVSVMSICVLGYKPGQRSKPEEDEEIEVRKNPMEECRVSGGKYDTTNEVCIYDTQDEGKECVENRDCEGWCLAYENSEIGEEATGFCSDLIKPKGCFKFIDKGKVNQICLPE